MTKPPSNIRAILLDWAGTTIDYGSRAPTEVFIEIFRRRGITITVDEARGPMGRSKLDHIAAVASLPRVAEAWQARFGRAPSEDDVAGMYEEFLPLQKEVLARGAHVIPGIPEAIHAFRQAGIAIGSTTGYTRALMDVVIPLAAAEGYSPDVVICSDEAPEGRPAPWMNLRAAERLNAYPLEACVAVDDTPVGLQAGRNAGMWTVGVSQTGNALGLTEEEVAACPASELESRLKQIERDFREAGADMVVRSVADLPGVLLGNK